MPHLYFLARGQRVSVNGTVLQDAHYHCDDNAVLAVWVTAPSGCLPIGIALRVQGGRLLPHPSVHVCDYCDGSYDIRFVFRREQCYMPPSPYWQQYLSVDRITHALTCYRADGYAATIETDSELHTFSTPGELQNVDFTCRKLRRGHLLALRADCMGRKYLCVVFYDGDYRTLLDTLCDDIHSTREGLILTDLIDDMAQHSLQRTLQFHDGKYREVQREIVCRRPVVCQDELLPYLFCESLFCGDIGLCRDLCAHALSHMDFVSYFGKFHAVCDTPRAYRPFRIGLCYRTETGWDEVRYFAFTVRGGKISSVTRTSESQASL